jgi:RNA recognition motif-containing protein
MFFDKVYINNINIKTTDDMLLQIVKHFHKKKNIDVITICSVVVAGKCRIAAYYDFITIIQQVKSNTT